MRPYVPTIPQPLRPCTDSCTTCTIILRPRARVPQPSYGHALVSRTRAQTQPSTHLTRHAPTWRARAAASVASAPNTALHTAPYTVCVYCVHTAYCILRCTLHTVPYRTPPSAPIVGSRDEGKRRSRPSDLFSFCFPSVPVSRGAHCARVPSPPHSARLGAVAVRAAGPTMAARDAITAHTHRRYVT